MVCRLSALRVSAIGAQAPSEVCIAACTVVDWFRFRDMICVDAALEAMRDGCSQRQFTTDDVWHHATNGRVANGMCRCIETIAS